MRKKLTIVILLYVFIGIFLFFLSNLFLLNKSEEDPLQRIIWINFLKEVAFVLISGYLIYFFLNQKIKEKKSTGLEDIFDVSPVPMWIYDSENLIFLDINQAALDKFGYSRDEFLEINTLEIRSQQEALRLLNYLSSHESEEFAGIWEHISKNGDKMFSDIAFTNIFYKQKLAKLVIAKDMTRLINENKDLREESKNLSERNASLVAVVENLSSYNGTLFELLKQAEIFLWNYSISKEEFKFFREFRDGTSECFLKQVLKTSDLKNMLSENDYLIFNQFLQDIKQGKRSSAVISLPYKGEEVKFRIENTKAQKNAAMLSGFAEKER